MSACAVCGSTNPTVHAYGVVVCKACQRFFKVNCEPPKVKCCHANTCIITATNRSCRACRYAKCRQVGMLYPSERKAQEVVNYQASLARNLVANLSPAVRETKDVTKGVINKSVRPSAIMTPVSISTVSATPATVTSKSIRPSAISNYLRPNHVSRTPKVLRLLKSEWCQVYEAIRTVGEIRRLKHNGYKNSKIAKSKLAAENIGSLRETNFEAAVIDNVGKTTGTPITPHVAADAETAGVKAFRCHQCNFSCATADFLVEHHLSC